MSDSAPPGNEAKVHSHGSPGSLVWWPTFGRGAHRSNGGAAAAVGLALVLAPVNAAAYCRIDVCQSQGNCDGTAECPDSGERSVFWERACVPISVHADGSLLLGLSAEDARDLVMEALRTWTSVACPDGGSPSLVVTAVDPVECDEVGYNTCAPNANSWIFRDDDWPHAATALGYTQPHFSTTTGVIHDADIEFNSARIAAEGLDVRAVLVHEAGHFLGLDHSPDEAATMYEDYGASEQATLSLDDVEGICAIYPPNREVGPCDLRPEHGLLRGCVEDDCSAAPTDDSEPLEPADGCAFVPAARPRLPGAQGVLIGVLLAASLLRRRAQPGS